MKLNDRMKTYYEGRSKMALLRRTPVIIRLDGKAFHTYTRNFEQPFSAPFAMAMIDTMEYLVKNVQNCVLGYTQSDEITLVLIDYKTLDTDAWFDNDIQKLCSVSASMATAVFNSRIKHHVDGELRYNHNLDDRVKDAYMNVLNENQLAFFDSRCFNIPEEEIQNCLIWRQRDCIRNSIQKYSHYYMSDKEMFKKTTDELVEILLSKYDKDWNALNTLYKYGSVVYKKPNAELFIDMDIPVFSEKQDYINNMIKNVRNERL